jgi:hypothetical protein
VVVTLADGGTDFRYRKSIYHQNIVCDYRLLSNTGRNIVSGCGAVIAGETIMGIHTMAVPPCRELAHVVVVCPRAFGFSTCTLGDFGFRTFVGVWLFQRSI